MHPRAVVLSLENMVTKNPAYMILNERIFFFMNFIAISTFELNRVVLTPVTYVANLD